MDLLKLWKKDQPESEHVTVATIATQVFACEGEKRANEVLLSFKPQETSGMITIITKMLILYLLIKVLITKTVPDSQGQAQIYRPCP